MAAVYKHGIETEEREINVVESVEGTSGLQVIVGTAPSGTYVNTPLLVSSASEAMEKLGYSEDFERYTLCASMLAMSTFRVTPAVFINVLDPARHKKDNAEKEYQVTNKAVTYNVENVIESSITVKNGDAKLAKGTDYLVDVTGAYPVISLLTSGSAADATAIKISSSSVDPAAVAKEDIIGGYDAATGAMKGLECIRQVYPMFGMVPGLLLAPGWSQVPEVAAVMQAKTQLLNGVFDTFAVLDIDTERAKTYDTAAAAKDGGGINSSNAVALWPMVKFGGKNMPYSAVWAAMTAYTDAEHNDMPYKSPSNELVNVSAAVLKDGTEVNLDQEQAAELNGAGIVTAINLEGWRSWGNNTAAYPGTDNNKDRWIACRRMLNWYKNRFILQYVSTIDQPNNPRLVENLVDSENLFLNGLTANGYIAGGRISYVPEANPIGDVLDGDVVFDTNIAFWTPAKYIKNRIVFNPNLIQQAFENARA